MALKQLTNDLTWSVSRDRLFRTCQRGYYYSYYGSWGGWDPQSPARKYYILKQIQSFPLWGGGIVHDLIRTALVQFRADHRPFTAEGLQKAARERLRTGWLQSARGDWRQDPKRAVNLFEHFYGDGSNTVPAEETDALKAKVYDALANFVSCDTVAELLTLPENNWRSIDTLDKFIAGDLPTDEGTDYPLPVWCALDLAYVDRDNRLHIVDWKTGHENQDELLLQLSCYARYAMTKWNVPLQDIVLEGVFLNDGGRRKPYTVNENSISTASRHILASAQKMRLKIRDKAANTCEEEDFPCSPSACRFCPYQKLCPMQ